jgi:hypothetical protein
LISLTRSENFWETGKAERNIEWWYWSGTGDRMASMPLFYQRVDKVMIQSRASENERKNTNLYIRNSASLFQFDCSFK